MKRIVVGLLLVGACAGAALRPAGAAETRISIGVTETMDTFNPYADNIVLLHFSSCLMMQDGKASALARSLQKTVQFPISGYDRSVDWAASALIEFHYLDMVLGRGLSPAEAAEQVLHLIGYAGDKDVPNSPYPAAGFRILMPEKVQASSTVGHLRP